MTLTPSAIRNDLKCGKGAISKGEKCHKGVATAVAVGATVGVAGVLLLNRKKAALISKRAKAPGADMELLSSGTRGNVWVSKDNKTIIKTAKNTKEANKLLEEARVQTKAHKAGVSTPRIISVDNKNKTISMENLQGYKPLINAVKDSSEQQKAAYARSLVENLRKAHLADIAHGDLNTNVLASGGKLSIIDWGQSSPVRHKGMADILNAIRIADQLDPAFAKSMKQAFKPLQVKFSSRRELTVADFNAFYDRVNKRGQRSDGPSTEYYRTHPEAAAKKVRTQAKINRRPEERERRAELNRERRKRGIDGQGGPDMSHTTSGRMVAEAPSTNRARNGHGDQPRLRKDSGVVFVTPRLVDPGRQDACWAGYVQAGMKRKGKKEVPNCVPASSGLKKPRAQRDAEGDGKKYTKVVTNPETGRKKRIRYGAKGYRIAPGTDKGDRYCARSFGDMKSHGKDCSGADRNTPLCLSRAKWKCSGESSRRGDALTPGKS